MWASFPKVILLSKYWQNRNTEVREKIAYFEQQYLENGKT